MDNFGGRKPPIFLTAAANPPPRNSLMPFDSEFGTNLASVDNCGRFFNACTGARAGIRGIAAPASPTLPKSMPQQRGMHMFSTISAAVASLVSIIAIVFALRARSYARQCYQFVERVAGSSANFSELATLSAELTTQKDALAQISKGLRTIRNRMNVRETNARRKVDQEKPAEKEESEDEAWLRAANARMAAGGRRAFELETGDE